MPGEYQSQLFYHFPGLILVSDFYSCAQFSGAVRPSLHFLLLIITLEALYAYPSTKFIKIKNLFRLKCCLRFLRSKGFLSQLGFFNELEITRYSKKRLVLSQKMVLSTELICKLAAGTSFCLILSEELLSTARETQAIFHHETFHTK